MTRGIALAAALLLTGCASVPANKSLANTEWTVSAINGQPTPVEASNYRMSFKDRDLGAQFGCNHIGGAYRVIGDTLSTTGTTMTEMACIGPADEHEGQGVAVLQRSMRIGWKGPTSVTLSNDAGIIALEKR